MDPTAATAGDPISLYRTTESEVNSALYAMGSRNILEGVVDNLGVETILSESTAATDSSTPPPFDSFIQTAGQYLASIDPIDDYERAIIQLEKSLKFEAARTSSVINVSYRAKSPEFAQLAARAWVESYLGNYSQMNSTPGSLAFFESQECTLTRLLNETYAKLQQAKTQSDVITIASKQRILEQQITLTRTSMIQNRADLAATAARVESLENQLAATAPSTITSEATANSNEARSRMRDRLFALEIKEQGMSSTFSATHPIRLAVANQVESVRDLLADHEQDSKEVVQGTNPVYVTLTERLADAVAQKESLAAASDELNSQNEHLSAKLGALNDAEVEIAALERKVRVLEDEFVSQHRRHEQARLATALEARRIQNVNIIQEPTLERRPASPSKKLCALLGFIASTLAAGGFVTVYSPTAK